MYTFKLLLGCSAVCVRTRAQPSAALCQVLGPGRVLRITIVFTTHCLLWGKRGRLSSLARGPTRCVFVSSHIVYPHRPRPAWLISSCWGVGGRRVAGGRGGGWGVMWVGGVGGRGACRVLLSYVLLPVLTYRSDVLMSPSCARPSASSFRQHIFLPTSTSPSTLCPMCCPLFYSTSFPSRARLHRLSWYFFFVPLVAPSCSSHFPPPPPHIMYHIVLYFLLSYFRSHLS